MKIDNGLPRCHSHARDDRWTYLEPGETLPVRGWFVPEDGELAIDWAEPFSWQHENYGKLVIHTFVSNSGHRFYSTRGGVCSVLHVATLAEAVRLGWIGIEMNARHHEAWQAGDEAETKRLSDEWWDICWPAVRAARARVDGVEEAG